MRSIRMFLTAALTAVVVLAFSGAAHAARGPVQVINHSLNGQSLNCQCKFVYRGDATGELAWTTNSGAGAGTVSVDGGEPIAGTLGADRLLHATIPTLVGDHVLTFVTNGTSNTVNFSMVAPVDWAELTPAQWLTRPRIDFDANTMPTWGDAGASSSMMDWVTGEVTGHYGIGGGQYSNGSDLNYGAFPRCTIWHGIETFADDPAVCTMTITVPANPDFNRVALAYRARGSAGTTISVQGPQRGVTMLAEDVASGDHVVSADTANGEAVTFTLTVTSGVWDGMDVPSFDELEIRGIAKANAVQVAVEPPAEEPVVAPVVVVPTGGGDAPAAAAAITAPSNASSKSTGQVGIKRVEPKKNAAPTLTVQVIGSAAGRLQDTNMLTLRVRASEWSVWDVKIGGTTFLRHALVRAKWRTVRINLGDVTPIGKKLNDAEPGQFLRIPIALQGRDAKQKRSKTRVQYVMVQA